eukprot:jgi/Botrbrau1/23433/Bobra.0884s0001.1
MPVHDGPNYFEEHQYDGATSFFGGTPPLSQAVGYLVVVGFGALFSAITVGMVWLDYMFGGAHKTSEQFNTAGRSIKTGLIAVDIVRYVATCAVSTPGFWVPLAVGVAFGGGQGK